MDCVLPQIPAILLSKMCTVVLLLFGVPDAVGETSEAVAERNPQYVQKEYSISVVDMFTCLHLFIDGETIRTRHAGLHSTPEFFCKGAPAAADMIEGTSNASVTATE